MAQNTPTLLVSEMAENLIGSEIIKLAAEVHEKIRNGERVFNYTIGDFDSNIFPIPAELTTEIIAAYRDNQTNYPAANGVLELRKEIAEFLEEHQGLNYSAEEILVAGGARPLIFAFYTTILDKGDTVVFPVPSWNNNHYCHLTQANAIFVETQPENNFMPTADELRPHLANANLLSLCSPLNPTGTVFSHYQLETICELVLEENRRRGPGVKPLYIMFDQVYWVLTFGGTQHFDPVRIRPELRPYTVFIDGMSKSFAATGIRVGWAFGPQRIMDKMKAVLTHVGAWAPKAEQVAAAKFLKQKPAINNFLIHFKNEISERLERFYNGFHELKNQGFPVDAIAPQAAIYLTVNIKLQGKKTASGKVLQTQKDVTQFLLDEVHLAIVPFAFFGANENSTWYRLSVGTCNKTEIDELFLQLKKVLSSLS